MKKSKTEKSGDRGGHGTVSSNPGVETIKALREFKIKFIQHYLGIFSEVN